MSLITREKVDNRLERSVVLHSITSTEYLSRVCRMVSPEYFKAPFSKTVYSWASEYYEQFKKAPGRDIQELYILHKTRLNSEENDLISVFLSSLNDEYDNNVDNIGFLVKQTEDWASFRALEIARDKINLSLESRDFFSGEQAIAEFKKVKEFSHTSVNALSDKQAIAKAFTSDEQFLFRFQGDVGRLIGDFNRTDFVGFLGFLKSGKSFVLKDCAVEGQKAGHNVLLVNFEMPEEQVLKRIWQPMLGKPLKSRNVKLPYFYKDNEDDEKYHIGFDSEYLEGLDPDVEMIDRVVKDYTKYHPSGSIRVACFPSMSTTVDDLKTYVKNLAFYEGYVPDIIVIDYADLMLSKVKGEKRHQLSEIWASLRGWALADNICIITASQAGRSASNSDATEENIAEDISKMAHVTKMVAINSTKEERSDGIRRMAMLATRDEEAIYDQVYVLTCLEMGMFFVDSKFRSSLDVKKSE